MNRTARTVAAVAAIFSAACFAGLPSAPGMAAGVEPHTVTDATGRKVEIRDLSRIVTIGGAVTETVFALGHGDDVVAIDLTSTYPPDARKLPSIGYMRALSAEGVISLAPSLILAIEGSGPPDVIEILKSASVPVVIVPEGYNEAAVLRKVRVIADVLGETEKGETVARAIEEDFRAMEQVRARLSGTRSGVFVLAVGGGSPTIGGAKTSADGIFALSGIDNAMKQVSGFKPASAEGAFNTAPQVVVTMIERNHGLSPDEMFALPAFAGTPAARDKRLIPIPSYYLSFGPRTAHAARSLAAAVYPELNLPTLPPRPWTTSAPAAAK